MQVMLIMASASVPNCRTLFLYRLTIVNQYFYEHPKQRFAGTYKRVTMKPGELKHEIERIIELLGQFENMDAYCWQTR